MLVLLGRILQFLKTISENCNKLMLAMASKEHNSDPFPKYFNKEDQNLLRIMSIAGPKKVAFSGCFIHDLQALIP